MKIIRVVELEQSDFVPGKKGSWNALTPAASEATQTADVVRYNGMIVKHRRGLTNSTLEIERAKVAGSVELSSTAENGANQQVRHAGEILASGKQEQKL